MSDIYHVGDIFVGHATWASGRKPELYARAVSGGRWGTPLVVVSATPISNSNGDITYSTFRRDGSLYIRISPIFALRLQRVDSNPPL